MCFRFGSCFGSGSGQDHGPCIQDDHGGYYSGIDHESGPQLYHLQPAADEAPRNVHYNDGGARKDKADDEAPKHTAAWSGKVGDNVGHTYMACLQEDAAAADPRQNAAADYHNYQTTTTTALARY